MENKLQELTRKLYDEGLSKGQKEAEELIARAEEQAGNIVDDAKAQAEAIIKEAQKNAHETRRNTANEVELASRQSVNALKQQIEKIVVLGAVSPSVEKATSDADFIKDMLIALAGAWNGASGQKIELTAMLPESTKETLGKKVADSVVKQLSSGLEIRFDGKIKSGFRIGPKDGSYYVSFSNEDFNALLGEYLRPQVAKMLFSEEK